MERAAVPKQNPPARSGGLMEPPAAGRRSILQRMYVRRSTHCAVQVALPSVPLARRHDGMGLATLPARAIERPNVSTIVSRHYTLASPHD
jgi:hypothetical protein